MEHTNQKLTVIESVPDILDDEKTQTLSINLENVFARLVSLHLLTFSSAILSFIVTCSNIFFNNIFDNEVGL